MELVEILNALRANGPELRKAKGAGLYRLFRLVAMEDILGNRASVVNYYAGKKLGLELGLKSLDEFLVLCDDLKIGIIKIFEMRDDFIHVDVYECATCDGKEPVGRAICSFEGGFIAGAVESITGKKTTAKEVTCIGGLGHETCGFDLTLKEH